MALMMAPIVHSVRFSASARELYDIYLDPERHAAVTGAAVKISARPGSKFSAFDGMLSGVTVAVVPGLLIVQRWRSCEFHESDPDSVLVLSFVQEGKGGRIDLVHANVPKHDHAGVTEGWEKYYWKPLRAYLKRSLTAPSPSAASGPMEVAAQGS
jgi:activator of HSP90 ATPase